MSCLDVAQLMCELHVWCNACARLGGIAVRSGLRELCYLEEVAMNYSAHIAS